MNNKEIARIFEDVGGILQLKDENVFKIRAYQKVARTIAQLPVELEVMKGEGRLREVPGVGDAIEKKIVEILETGKLDLYEKLKAEFPPGVSTLIDIPGIGPKTALLLAGKLKIQSVEQLEAAIASGAVAQLPRMGDKTAQNILRHVRSLRRKDTRIPLGEAMRALDEVIASLKQVARVEHLTPAGSLRRFNETIGDIDIMGTADDPEAVIDSFVSLPATRLVLAKGTTKASILMASGLQVDLRIVEHDAFGSLLQHFTGSRLHNVALRERARRMGLSLSEYGITDIETGHLEKFVTEEAFYRRQGLQYIPPEIREGTREIELAANDSIPSLVEQGDIKGDLHVHSVWTDGKQTIKDMAVAARTRGYDYICISDHSSARGISRGLDVDRLEQQLHEIAVLREEVEGIRILSGIEVDIRNDGTLDMPDALLERLDVVTGSVHSGLGQSRDQLTERVLRAMDNPNLDILGHPTGRLMPRREPANLDIEAVLQKAKSRGTVLEINSMPSRLDLKDTDAQRAQELGVMLAINTDSHSSEHYEFLRFGVGVARRGWCRASDILNTRPLESMMHYLRTRERA